jgi:hypothetical protein
MGPHDLETFRHQMSTYLSNALTGNVGGTNPNNERPQIQVPPPHYLPFLMGHIDEKVLTRLPTTTPTPTHPNLGLLYHHHHHHHPTQSSNINISSASPTSSSSNSSTSDIHEQASSYLTTFDHHRRVKLEIQDATA